MKFSDRPQSTEEILRLISRTATGRQILEEFLPRYHERKVCIRNYPLEVLDRLRSMLGPGQPVGACFMNDGDCGVIYIDGSSPLGVLAPFLLHEMVHSLDRSLWKAAKVPTTKATKDELFLGAETKAFESQHRFIRELIERFPDYQVFLSTQFPRARILNDRLTTTDIADLYGFKIEPKAS